MTRLWKTVHEWWRTRSLRGSEGGNASPKMASVASEVLAKNLEEAQDFVFHDALRRISESRVRCSTVEPVWYPTNILWPLNIFRTIRVTCYACLYTPGRSLKKWCEVTFFNDIQFTFIEYISVVVNTIISHVILKALAKKWPSSTGLRLQSIPVKHQIHITIEPDLSSEISWTFNDWEAMY